jgi:glycosyltransferase involved in cell wall biosynthesis
VTDKPPKVVICCPTYTRPHQAVLDALEAAIPAMDAAGIDHNLVWRIGSPYISAARAEMLRKALDAKADIIVFLDHDVAFQPGDIVKLIQTPGDVVAGLYRYKDPDGPPKFMGCLDTDESGAVKPRADGCVKATRIPAGFMKITPAAVDRFMLAYPELTYGPAHNPSTDLFNHGAHDRVWWGEDMAFSRRWVDCGGEIWVIPDLDLEHHDAGAAYPSNFQEFMLRQPGGALDPQRQPTASAA